LGIAGLALVVSMTFAIAFALTSSAGRNAPESFVPYHVMARFHGLANALGFATCGLLGFALAPPRHPAHRPSGALPRLFASRRLAASSVFVGPGFFARVSAVDRARTVVGQVRSLDDFAHATFDASMVHPEVRAFYERTAAYELRAAPVWHRPFRTYGRVFQFFARRVLGQLEVPTSRETEAVSTELFALHDVLDGRLGARGYVRTYGAGASRRANFVAAYAMQKSVACTYLSCAFPLPYCALLATLRFETAKATGSLYVTSAPNPRCSIGAGEEGMFLVSRFGAFKLPMVERIDVWFAEGRLHARHALRVFGLRCVTLDYEISKRLCSPAV
jgi:hypothetical protein